MTRTPPRSPRHRGSATTFGRRRPSMPRSRRATSSAGRRLTGSRRPWPRRVPDSTARLPEVTATPDAPGTPHAPDMYVRAPKALLHDHLDGGLRPATVIDLAAETGYTRPADHRCRRALALVSPRRGPQVSRAVPRDVRPHVRGHAGARRDHPGRRRVCRGPRRRWRGLRRGPDGARAVHGTWPDARRGRRRRSSRGIGSARHGPPPTAIRS